jgi:hypothetical protein
MRTLLAKHHVRFQPGQIQRLIESGRSQGLALDGVFAFVEDKLIEKRDRNDPVFSAKLLINALSDSADLHRWAVKRHRHSSFFNHPPKRTEPPFTAAELRAHLSDGAQKLRTVSGCEEIAAELDLLAADSEARLDDLEVLEQNLTSLEKNIVGIAIAQKSEEELMRIRRDVASQLEPYRGRMTADQLATLEIQCCRRRLFESDGLPRLSLFYLHPSRVAA